MKLLSLGRAEGTLVAWRDDATNFNWIGPLLLHFFRDDSFTLACYVRL